MLFTYIPVPGRWVYLGVCPMILLVHCTMKVLIGNRLPLRILPGHFIFHFGHRGIWPGHWINFIELRRQLRVNSERLLGRNHPLVGCSPGN